MAFKHGKDSEIWLGAVDLTTYLDGMDTSVDVDTAESTTYRADWKTYLTGIAGGGVEFSGKYDPTESNVRGTLDDTTASVVTVCPGGGGTIGDLARLIPALSTSYKETAPLGGVVAFKWSVVADGRMNFGYVLLPITAAAQTPSPVTGATRTDAAQTTTGWTAHLHVTAVTGGSWVIHLEDASASNFSDGADVTGGSFTAATGATSQRLQSAAGATLRRYVRFVATRTGGVAGDSITFGLALARSV